MSVRKGEQGEFDGLNRFSKRAHAETTQSQNKSTLNRTNFLQLIFFKVLLNGNLYKSSEMSILDFMLYHRAGLSKLPFPPGKTIFVAWRSDVIPRELQPAPGVW